MNRLHSGLTPYPCRIPLRAKARPCRGNPPATVQAENPRARWRDATLPGPPLFLHMTNLDPFAAISSNERAALDDLCGRSLLFPGDVKRVAFLHNASFTRVRSMLPAYRARQATVAAHTADPADVASPLPKIGPTPKPSRWSRTRK